MNSAKSAILTYHAIDTSGSVISVSPAEFRRHMEILADNEVPVVPLDRVRRVKGAVALTFDDGFRNFIDSALPVLRARRFHATVFVVSGHAGGKNDWPSQPAGIPSLDLMNWAELRGIAGQGIALGAHTVTHPRLTELAADRVRGELRDCRARIEDRAGAEVAALAYPYGDCDPLVRLLAKEEFPIACGTALRLLETADDPLELPRIDSYYLRNEWTLRHLLGLRGRAYIRARGWMRAARAAVRS